MKTAERRSRGNYAEVAETRNEFFCGFCVVSVPSAFQNFFDFGEKKL
jgi:hypothetical protein